MYDAIPYCLYNNLCAEGFYFLKNLTYLHICYTGFFLGGCWYVLILAPQQYFNKRRGLAGGITSIGSSAGFFIFGPLTQFLSEYYGWRGARLILCGAMMNVIPLSMLYRPLVCLKTTRPVVVPKRIHTLSTSSEIMPAGSFASAYSLAQINYSENANKNSPPQNMQKKMKCLSILSGFLSVFGQSWLFFSVFMMYNHIVNRSLNLGLTINQSTLLMSALGLSNLIGRVVFTVIASFSCTSITAQCSVCALVMSISIFLVGFVNGFLDSAVVIVTAGISIGEYTISTLNI